MNPSIRLKPLFQPGRLLVAPEALQALSAHQIPVISVLLRHIAGDWGIVSEDDRAQNDLSIAAGLRLLAVYPLPDGARILVVTEWDRSQTTIELLEQASPRGIAPRQPDTHCSYPAWPAATCRTRIAA